MAPECERYKGKWRVQSYARILGKLPHWNQWCLILSKHALDGTENRKVFPVHFSFTNLHLWLVRAYHIKLSPRTVHSLFRVAALMQEDQKRIRTAVISPPEFACSCSHTKTWFGVMFCANHVLWSTVKEITNSSHASICCEFVFIVSQRNTLPIVNPG